LIWHPDFSQRLRAWQDLRGLCASLPAPDALASINAWWFRAPWSSYYLHWDDRQDWPDPWQLLSDNIYCEVARGLGMLYTVMMLDRHDIAQTELLDCTHGTVLAVDQTKYILNWAPDRIVNISSETGPVRRSVTQQFFHNKI
jgi:hypothetical protein